MQTRVSSCGGTDHQAAGWQPACLLSILYLGQHAFCLSLIPKAPADATVAAPGRVSICNGVTVHLCVNLALELLRPLQAPVQQPMGSPPASRYMVLLQSWRVSVDS